MIEWAALGKGIAALAAVVDPIGIAPIFASMAPKSWPERKAMADAAALTTFIALLAFAVAGSWILALLGISLAAFKAAGGVLLMLMALEMLRAKHPEARATAEEEARVASQPPADLAHARLMGVSPMGLPLLAGPAAISAVIIQSSGNAMDPGMWGATALSIAAVSLLSWGCMRGAGKIAERLGMLGVNVMTRVMGLILAALSVETLAQGLGELLPGLAGKVVGA